MRRGESQRAIVRTLLSTVNKSPRNREWTAHANSSKWITQGC
jgi:hypothetical protein